MSKITICDLCGERIEEYNAEHYKFKKKYCCLTSCFWDKIDVHRECRRKLFYAIQENKNRISGGTAMQDH